MIAFAAPNITVTREPVENPHKKRIPHGASTDALGLSPAFASARKIGRKAKPEAGVNPAPDCRRWTQPL